MTALTMSKTPLQILVPMVMMGQTHSAFAQEADDESTKPTLEVIEVRAQKRVQNLQDVPVAVTAISCSALDDQVIEDIFDLEANVPGLRTTLSSNSTQSSVSIRGVGTSGTNFGLESSVGLYVDGVYRSRQNTMINDYVDVDAVEVLRGPQGTLFGKNSPMGAINVRNVAPEHGERNGFVDLALGNYGLINYSGATNLTAIEDELSFRITGFGSRRDGTVSDVNFGEDVVNDRDRYGVRLQALYTPTEDLSVRIIADYSEIDEICCGSNAIVSNAQASGVPGRAGSDALFASPLFNATVIPASAFDNRIQANNILPVSQLEDQGISAEIIWEISDKLTLTSVSGLRESNSFDSLDTDLSDVDLNSRDTIGDQSSFSQELRLNYSSEGFNYVGGIFYFSQDLDSVSTLISGEDLDSFALNGILAGAATPLLEGINQLSLLTGGLIAPSAAPTSAGARFSQNARQDHESYAIFGQFDYQITDALTITAGLRYTNETKDLVNLFTEDYLSGAEHPTFFTSVGQPNVPQTLIPGSVVFGALAAQQSLQAIQSGLVQPGTPEFAQAAQTLTPFQSEGWLFNALSPQTTGRPDEVAELDDEQVTGTIKLSYEFDQYTLAYVSYGTGFKSGGTNTDRVDAAFDTVFGAETSQSYEVGLKKDFPEEALRLNIALHSTKVEDFQANSFVGNGFNLQNAGDYEINGLELEARWLATDNTTLVLNYALVDAEYAEFDQGPCWIVTPWQTGQLDPGQESLDPATPNPFCNRAGDKPAMQPEHSGMIQISHEMALTDDVWATASVDYNYIGEFFSDASNDPLSRVDAEGLVNARLSFDIDDYDLKIILWGRNITDKDLTGGSAPAPLQTGRLVAFYTDPATYGISLIKRFD